MDPVGFGPGLIQGEGGLVVAVEAVAVEHQSLALGWFRFSVFGFRFKDSGGVILRPAI